MAFELREVREWALWTVVHPKYEVFDQRGDTNYTITACTFALYDRSGDEVVAGNCTVNNADTDLVGNTIKTVEASIDLSATWAAVGHYVLVFTVTMASNETDKLSVPVKIRSVP